MGAIKTDFDITHVVVEPPASTADDGATTSPDESVATAAVADRRVAHRRVDARAAVGERHRQAIRDNDRFVVRVEFWAGCRSAGVHRRKQTLLE
ncbi:MAG: hypothetical protein IPK60_20610 [Sandaracinaceae bacterium]|nr:hypothetical protein [Sandaracinaceae bacterium]